MRSARALLLALLFLTACPSSHPKSSPERSSPSRSSSPPSSSPFTISKSSQARPYIKNARLTHFLFLTVSGIRLDPPAERPKLTEARAVALWESASGFGDPLVTADAMVFLARATVPRTSDLITNIHHSAATFSNRLSWVFLWTNEIRSCPRTSTFGYTPSPPPPPKQTPSVEVIAADGSGEGLTVSPEQTQCTLTPEGSAVPASYHLSIPWKLVDVKGNFGVVQATTPSLCSYLGSTGGGSLGSRFAVDVVMLMVQGPCTVKYPKDARDVSAKVELFGPEIHAPTGLVLGRATSRFTLLYYDGQTHSVSLGCYANPGRGGNPPLKC